MAAADLGTVGFEREVAAIEEFDLGVRNVALERLGARRKKERIVLSPGRQQRRFMGSEVILKFRIERDIAFVVAEQVKLHVVCAGSG